MLLNLRQTGLRGSHDFIVFMGIANTDEAKQRFLGSSVTLFDKNDFQENSSTLR